MYAHLSRVVWNAIRHSIPGDGWLRQVQGYGMVACYFGACAGDRMDFCCGVWDNGLQMIDRAEGESMESSERYPSYVATVAKALSAAPQPLSVEHLVEEVAGQRPNNKGTRSAVYRALKQLFQAVPVAPGRYGWLSNLLRDNYFRHTLSADEVRKGHLLLDELEHAVFFPQFFQYHRADARRVKVELFGGEMLQAEAAIERKTWCLRIGKPLTDWIDEQGGQAYDDIIIGVLDAGSGVYTLRLQPREARDEETIQSRNMEVAATAEELVVASRREQKMIPTWELAAMLIGRGLFGEMAPPDDLHLVLHTFSGLALQEGIGYTMAEHSPIMRSVVKPAAQYRSTDVEMKNNPFGGSPWNGDDWDDEDDEFGAAANNDDDGDDETCADYESYVDYFRESKVGGAPLSHDDYHLLEAELELLIGLEQEFGYLLPDQQRRVEELGERLFIDLDALRNDLDMPGGPGADDPPFWVN